MGDYKRDQLQALIKKLMGNQTLVDFAKGCGISRSNLSVWLNSEATGGQLSKATLRRISEYTGYDYDALLVAGGYGNTKGDARRHRPLEDRLRACAKDMGECLADMTGKLAFFDGLTDFLDYCQMLYMGERCEFHVRETRELHGDGHHKAEMSAVVRATIGSRNRFGHLYFVLYYAETVGGQVIITDMAFDGASVMDAGLSIGRHESMDGMDEAEIRQSSIVYTIENCAEVRLLAAIFGEGESKIVHRNIVDGFGFRIPPAFAGLTAFLRAHAAAYAQLERHIREALNTRLKQKALSPNDGVTWRAIASIMKQETGIHFAYYATDFEADTELPPCIMVEAGQYSGSMNALQRAVCAYARELGVAEYGDCLASVAVYDRQSVTYRTADDVPEAVDNDEASADGCTKPEDEKTKDAGMKSCRGNDDAYADDLD